MDKVEVRGIVCVSAEFGMTKGEVSGAFFSYFRRVEGASSVARVMIMR